jgi:hypothetical protein
LFGLSFDFVVVGFQAERLHMSKVMKMSDMVRLNAFSRSTDVSAIPYFGKILSQNKIALHSCNQV